MGAGDGRHPLFRRRRRQGRHGMRLLHGHAQPHEGDRLLQSGVCRVRPACWCRPTSDIHAFADIGRQEDRGGLRHDQREGRQGTAQAAQSRCHAGHGEGSRRGDCGAGDPARSTALPATSFFWPAPRSSIRKRWRCCRTICRSSNTRSCCRAGDWAFRLAVNTGLAQFFRAGKTNDLFERWFFGSRPGPAARGALRARRISD